MSQQNTNPIQSFLQEIASTRNPKQFLPKFSVVSWKDVGAQQSSKIAAEAAKEVKDLGSGGGCSAVFTAEYVTGPAAYTLRVSFTTLTDRNPTQAHTPHSNIHNPSHSIFAVVQGHEAC